MRADLRWVGVIGTVALSVWIASTSAAFGDTHFVSLLGGNVTPFTNWPTAATNLQAAIDCASLSDTVLVSNGTYSLSATVRITNHITVCGMSSPEQVVVDGGRQFTCFYLDASNAVLDGLTITKGVGYEDAHPFLSFGGGVFCMSGKVRRCVIADNEADLGGGVVLVGAGASVEDCRIQGNWAPHSGGGLAIAEGKARRCYVTGNRSGGSGGCDLVKGEITDSIIVRNSGEVGGVAMSSEPYGAPRLVRNCTIVWNEPYDAYSAAGGLSCEDGIVENCIMYFNRGRLSNNYEGLDAWNCRNSCTTPLIPGHCTNFTGTVTNDPQLTPSFRLRNTSPCIDAGMSSNASTTDIDGEPRWDHPGHSNRSSIVDIGADEFVDVDLDSMADSWETQTFGNVTNRDGRADGDADGLNDTGEYENGTEPGNSDTDADRMPDGWEVRHTLNPLADDADSDLDKDGMVNVGEYRADTRPNDSNSVLSVLSVFRRFGGARVTWRGGADAWQFLDRCDALTPTGAAWTPLLDFPPPTPLTNSVLDPNPGEHLFYRIRARRQ